MSPHASRALLTLLLLTLALSFTLAPCPAVASRPWLVAIDVGHSLARPGATSARGRPEYLFNRDFARVLATALDELGIKSFFLDSGKRHRSPEQRGRLAARDHAHILISVHHDSAQPHYLQTWTHEGKKLRHCDLFQGYSLFYSELGSRPARSLVLAKAIGERLRNHGFAPTAHHAEPIPGENREFVDPERGVYRFDHLRLLKSAAMPAVLLECGVIIHREEELLSRDPERQRRMAVAVAQGIADFLHGNSTPTR
jgi:N-acetylmuramoyl-L-alanine amidase